MPRPGATLTPLTSFSCAEGGHALLAFGAPHEVVPDLQDPVLAGAVHDPQYAPRAADLLELLGHEPQQHVFAA
jgi:hypothetical protein